ncbi:TIR domain-containing protein [Weissella confusa]
MVYRNKVYVAFDGDEDMMYYRLLAAWSKNDNIDFDLNNAHDLKSSKNTSSEETIKRSLRDRMSNSKVFVLLVGEKTKFLYKFVRWEIETAIKMQLPIIVVNLNGNRQTDDLLPPILRDELLVATTFHSKILNHALKKWPESDKKHRKNGEVGHYYYPDSVYEDLGL